MKTIGAAKFKEQCLALLENLDREGLIITKHGRPVAKLIPLEVESAHLIGMLKGKIRIKGDLLHVPLLTRDRQIRKSRIVPLA